MCGTIRITSRASNNITFQLVDTSLNITNEAELYHILLMSPQVRHDLLSCQALGWIYTHINLHHDLLSLPLIIPLGLSDELFTFELQMRLCDLLNQLM